MTGGSRYTIPLMYHVLYEKTSHFILQKGTVLPVQTPLEGAYMRGTHKHPVEFCGGQLASELNDGKLSTISVLHKSKSDETWKLKQQSLGKFEHYRIISIPNPGCWIIFHATGGFAESRALARTWCGILPSATEIRRFGDLSLASRFSTCWDWELVVGTWNNRLTRPYGTQWQSDVSNSRMFFFVLKHICCARSMHVWDVEWAEWMKRWSCSILWLASWLILPLNSSTVRNNFSFEWPHFSRTDGQYISTWNL